MVGTELDGRYRILSKLGEGAMGEVYLVEHLGLGRKEALKILRASLDDSPTLVARFRREARATNRLQHHNIVSVYDFGRLPDGRFYISNEFADGDALDRVLARTGVLPVPRAVAILYQLAEAIDHAHSRGVIHRDLKPANLILVVRRGQADVLKVLDFGVAKIIAPDYAESMGATGRGEVFGTPSYMAPEQIGARGDDPRIDIYQFGCIAFELVTGQPPFTGRTLEVMNDHLHKAAPTPSEVKPDAGISVALDHIILRCLEKRPQRRFQSGAEIAAALSELTTAPVAVMPPESRRSAAVDITNPDVSPRWFIAETTEAEPDSPPAAPAADRSEARQAFEAVLLQLAETLIDHGCSDFHITITAADIAGTRGELDAVVSRMRELELARTSLDKRARDSAARFRFAVGELRFELEQARQRGAVNPDIEFQLGHLESRMAELAAQSERELDAIEDRAITLAADRDNLEEQLADRFATLEQLVNEVLPRFRGRVAVVDELAQRAGEMRAGLPPVRD